MLRLCSPEKQSLININRTGSSINYPNQLFFLCFVVWTSGRQIGSFFFFFKSKNYFKCPMRKGRGGERGERGNEGLKISQVRIWSDLIWSDQIRSEYGNHQFPSSAATLSETNQRPDGRRDQYIKKPCLVNLQCRAGQYDPSVFWKITCTHADNSANSL